MVYTKITFKTIGIEFDLIEIDHLFCNTRLCLACVQNVKNDLKFSLKVNLFSPKTPHFCPLMNCVHFSLRAHISSLHCAV